MKQLTRISTAAAIMLLATTSEAALFEGSYTLNGGEVIAFTAEGTLQGNNDTVLIDDFVGTPTFDGVAPVVTNPQFFGNTASLSGTTLDLSWFGDGSVGFQLTSFFSSGPGYGNVQESLNNSFTLTQVPEPSSLALLGLGGVLVARRRHS